jgi:bifunctional pyridoxal-dependent enzyme with beta-cystathionase and maltose regulon repressor activities
MSAIGVPVFPCQGTLMAWVDFRQYLREPKDHAAEYELYLDLCDNHKIIFTTGDSCRSEVAGFYRLCFAYPDIGTSKDMQVAMKELKKRLIAKFGQKE